MRRPLIFAVAAAFSVACFAQDIPGFTPAKEPLKSTYVAPMPEPWTEPGFLHLRYIQSPNNNKRPDTAVVDTVVVHATVIPTLEKTVFAFRREASQVSAHYTIGRDGSIVQMVTTFNRAWHAGVSKDVEGRNNVNHFSVGIELVNLDDGKDPYPKAQTDALCMLIRTLKRRFPLKYITSHEYIAQPHGRKNDPAMFPWDTLKDCGLKIVRNPGV